MMVRDHHYKQFNTPHVWKHLALRLLHSWISHSFTFFYFSDSFQTNCML